jgi:hypothetical protein
VQFPHTSKHGRWASAIGGVILVDAGEFVVLQGLWISKLRRYLFLSPLGAFPLLF